MIYHGYQDISIAVSTDRGLVTPVLRDAQDMGFADIEKAIIGYAKKAREGGLSLDDLQGGTFTINTEGELNGATSFSSGIFSFRSVLCMMRMLA